MSGLFSLNTLVILGILITAVIAVVSEKILTSVIALGVTGGLVALEFILLQAPDVAISEAAVGAVLSTALFVFTIRKTTKKEDEEK
ncbi:MAG: DUF4040 domain-containing protein [Lachnospiraceae bacterium]|nr:DUF4040 domain-containing protein [Lachnospiraceae bacterium]